MTDDLAAQTLRQAAAGWQRFGAQLEETVQTLDREVARARAAHWSGSGAEGFDEQWGRLRGAVQEVLPGFAAVAADLEAAAEAALAALEAERAERENEGAHSFDGEDALFGGDVGGGDFGSGETAGGAGSTSYASLSASGGEPAGGLGPPPGEDVLAQLDEVLREENGNGPAKSDASSAGEISSEGYAAAASADLPAGANPPASQPSPALENRVGGAPEEERAGSGAGAVPVPTATSTAAVVASLAQFAAALADVFTSPAGVAPDGSGTPAPPGAAAPRPSDVPLGGGAPPADPATGTTDATGAAGSSGTAGTASNPPGLDDGPPRQPPAGAFG